MASLTENGNSNIPAEARRRGIGSERYEDYLLDIMTEQYYWREDNREMLKPDISDCLKQGGHGIWKSLEEQDPYELLAFAVVRQAVEDYVDILHKMIHSKYPLTHPYQAKSAAQLHAIADGIREHFGFAWPVFEELILRINRFEKAPHALTYSRIMRKQWPTASDIRKEKEYRRKEEQSKDAVNR